MGGRRANMSKAGRRGLTGHGAVGKRLRYREPIAGNGLSNGARL